MKLLLIDTDRDLIEMLSPWLKMVGYDVYHAFTIEHARQIWEERKPDLVMIETAIEGEKGLEMCRDVRHIHDAFVLAATKKGRAQDEIRFLESGADAYLRQPFLPCQLLAHLHALSRRRQALSAASPSDVIIVGDLRLDAVNSTVSINGKTASLTFMECKLLRFLAVNANTVCTGKQIISSLWGLINNGNTGVIKVHIYHLRQKIEKNPNEPIYLVTVRREGYKLVPH